MFGRPGTGEILLIIVALLLLFGSKRIPDLARSIGQALHMFRKGLREGSPDDRDEESPGSGEKRDGDS